MLVLLGAIVVADIIFAVTGTSEDIDLDFVIDRC